MQEGAGIADVATSAEPFRATNQDLPEILFYDVRCRMNRFAAPKPVPVVIIRNVLGEQIDVVNPRSLGSRPARPPRKLAPKRLKKKAPHCADCIAREAGLDESSAKRVDTLTVCSVEP